MVPCTGSDMALKENWITIQVVINLSPTLVEDGNVISFAAGNNHSAMVLADGSLWTFGSNERGQLGDGNNTNRLIPVKVVDEDVTQVAAGYDHTIFLKQDGSVWAMGRNDYGMLGDGTKLIGISL